MRIEILCLLHFCRPGFRTLHIPPWSSLDLQVLCICRSQRLDMGPKRVMWVRRYQGQCRALRPLGHQGYRLRSHNKDQPLCSGYKQSPSCSFCEYPFISHCLHCSPSCFDPDSLLLAHLWLGLSWIYCISANKSFSSPKTSSRKPYTSSKQQERQKHSVETIINFSHQGRDPEPARAAQQPQTWQGL